MRFWDVAREDFGDWERKGQDEAREAVGCVREEALGFLVLLDSALLQDPDCLAQVVMAFCYGSLTKAVLLLPGWAPRPAAAVEASQQPWRDGACFGNRSSDPRARLKDSE